MCPHMVLRLLEWWCAPPGAPPRHYQGDTWYDPGWAARLLLPPGQNDCIRDKPRPPSQPMRAKEVTAGTYRKEKSHAGNPYMETVCICVQLPEEWYSRRQALKTSGTAGSSHAWTWITLEIFSKLYFSLEPLCARVHSSHTQVQQNADQKCRVPWKAYSIVFCNTNWFRLPPWCDMDSLTFISWAWQLSSWHLY